MYKMEKQDILEMMAHADRMKNPIRQYPNKTMVSLFFDPTHVQDSYQVAARRLGMKTHTTTVTQERMEDHVKISEKYGDVLVLSHSDDDYQHRAEMVCSIPIIPAGKYENSIQALTDLYTLIKELEFRQIHIDSDRRRTLHITFLGYNRHVHPFVHLLKHFPNIDLHYVSRSDIDPELIPLTDVFYVSRKQEEDGYCVDRAFLSKTKHTSIVMHHLPRTTELSPEVDNNPRCVYFEQQENGIYMRMAALDRVFSKDCPNLRECFWIGLAYIKNRLSMFSLWPLVSTGVCRCV